MDRTVSFWWRWLVVSAAIVLAFGLVLVVLPGPMQTVFESLYYAPRYSADLGAEPVAYTAFMGGVLGAVMIGWAVLLLFVLFGSFRRMEPASWDMIAASLAAWFVSDTALSLWSGFWQNAILNTGLALMFAIPLAATYRQLHRRRFGGEPA